MRTPDDTERLAIVGKTGSGKTVAAAWHLSRRDFHLSPWIIVDFKRDNLLNQIGAEEIQIDDPIPSEPGLYMLHPLVGEKDELDAFFWRLWEHENCGLYVDEGYMIDPRSAAFNAILTQGRSKHIPVIMLSQRPTWISRFVLSEAEFYQVFHLNDIKDRKRVLEFMPSQRLEKLPKYFSYYYDVGDDTVGVARPVPDAVSIIATFDRRLSELREEKLRRAALAPSAISIRHWL